MVLFFLQVFLISFSGAASPGAVTAACIGQGSSNKHAGALIAAGHGIVELPLVIVLTFGAGLLFQNDIFQICIGLLGGAVLVWLGYGMFCKPGSYSANGENGYASKPIVTGMLLSLSNPYFFLWWATIGLSLINDAKPLGTVAFPIFFGVHWVCDLIWCWVLSFGSYLGGKIMSEHGLKWLLRVCGGAMVLFGARFIFLAVKSILVS